MTSYPNGNNRGVEMSVIGYRGYAIVKRTGNVQVGSNTCDTRDSCTAAEIAKGRLGHYGYGTEMYPYLASYSATTNDELVLRRDLVVLMVVFIVVVMLVISTFLFTLLEKAVLILELNIVRYLMKKIHMVII